MICQNCGHSFESGKICPVCKNDALLLNKARTSSLKQYNKGVVYAKEGDYSRAIDCLNRCILFDKRNYIARNLLGIVYFEVGMTSDALEQWIISASMKSEKNPAKKYIDSLQKNSRTLEKYNDAIAMYNKALGQFDSNCEDLAVIQLKKAVDFNPKFVEAYNLLSLHYLGNGERKKARFYIDKALSIDKRNPKALRYLLEATSKDEDGSKDFKSGYDENTYIKNKIKKFIKTEFIAFIAGIIITGAMSWMLIAPAIKDGLSSQVKHLSEKVKALEEENLNGTSKFALQYKNLEEDNAVLAEENKRYKEEEKNRDQINNLQLANIYVASGKLAEAANLIHSINSDGLSVENKGLYDNLKKQSYPVGAKARYEQGNSYFSQGKNDEAEKILLEALDFGDKEDFMDNVLYILGQIYEAKGDIGQAKEYYGRILNEFSNSDIYKSAESKLKALLERG